MVRSLQAIVPVCVGMQSFPTHPPPCVPVQCLFVTGIQLRRAFWVTAPLASSDLSFFRNPSTPSSQSSRKCSSLTFPTQFCFQLLLGFCMTRKMTLSLACRTSRELCIPGIKRADSSNYLLSRWLKTIVEAALATVHTRMLASGLPLQLFRPTRKLGG